jgi:DNA ligase (NAD+)
MNSNLVEFKKDPYNYANNLEIDNIEKMIKYAADKYFNEEEPVISDSLYDLLIDFLRSKNPKSKVLKDVGSNVNSGHKVKLPYSLYSMDKIKPPSKDLKKWIEKFHAPYYLSDKLDGVSALIVYNNNDKIKLFTRGNATEGRDVSFLVKYLDNIPTVESIKSYMTDNKIEKGTTNMAFRGELVISKNEYSKYSDRFKNERAMVSGIVNSKKVNPILAKSLSLVIYEVVYPFTNIKHQYRTIKKIGFKRVNYLKTDFLSYEALSAYFKERRINSNYLIDGIIVNNNKKHKRNKKGNPKYAFAFKDVLEDQMSLATIKNVEWNASKDGYLNPVVNLEPVELGGVTIKRVTAYNAKFVKDNLLGKGAIVKIIRSGDVIPKIIEVLKKAKNPEMPDIEYEWNNTNVDILVKNKGNQDMAIKEILYFFKKMNIPNLGEGNIKKFYNSGFTSVESIIQATVTDFLKIDGVKQKSANKIYKGIHDKLRSTDLALLMAASNVFGHSFGYERAKLILEKYPNILIEYKSFTKNQLLENIISIPSFEEKMALQFIDYIDDFNKYLGTIKKYITLKKEKKLIIIGTKFKNKIIVFTGFRDKTLEEKIVKEGGKLGKSISKNTSILVCKDEETKNGTNSKIKDAKKKNIKILTKDELIKMLT